MIQSNNTFQVHEGLRKIFDRRFFPVRTCAFKLQHIFIHGTEGGILYYGMSTIAGGEIHVKSVLLPLPLSGSLAISLA